MGPRAPEAKSQVSGPQALGLTTSARTASERGHGPRRLVQGSPAAPLYWSCVDRAARRPPRRAASPARLASEGQIGWSCRARAAAKLKSFPLARLQKMRSDGNSFPSGRKVLTQGLKGAAAGGPA